MVREADTGIIPLSGGLNTPHAATPAGPPPHKNYTVCVVSSSCELWPQPFVDFRLGGSKPRAQESVMVCGSSNSPLPPHTHPCTTVYDGMWVFQPPTLPHTHIPAQESVMVCGSSSFPPPPPPYTHIPAQQPMTVCWPPPPPSSHFPLMEVEWATDSARLGAGSK